MHVSSTPYVLCDLTLASFQHSQSIMAWRYWICQDAFAIRWHGVYNKKYIEAWQCQLGQYTYCFEFAAVAVRSFRPLQVSVFLNAIILCHAANIDSITY